MEPVVMAPVVRSQRLLVPMAVRVGTAVTVRRVVPVVRVEIPAWAGSCSCSAIAGKTGRAVPAGTAATPVCRVMAVRAQTAMKVARPVVVAAQGVTREPRAPAVLVGSQEEEPIRDGTVRRG